MNPSPSSRLGRIQQRLQLLPLLPDYLYIRKQFRHTLGYELNLMEPRTFNEKIQWLKLFWRKDLLSECADKYAVRDFVARRVGPELLSECYGVWDDPEAIEFDSLPNSFVLKATHGCGLNLFCRDKSQFDRQSAYTQLKKWLKTNHFEHAREWAYRNIRPRILAEKYLGAGDRLPADYKLHCFNGQPKLFQIDTGRFTNQHLQSHYDIHWQLLPLHLRNRVPGPALEKPAQLPQLLHYAQQLAQGFPFVRVDFYLYEDRPLFGELTFYPTGGCREFVRYEDDLYWGSLLTLPCHEPKPGVSCLQQP